MIYNVWKNGSKTFLSGPSLTKDWRYTFLIYDQINPLVSNNRWRNCHINHWRNKISFCLPQFIDKAAAIHCVVNSLNTLYGAISPSQIMDYHLPISGLIFLLIWMWLAAIIFISYTKSINAIMEFHLCTYLFVLICAHTYLRFPWVTHGKRNGHV